MSNRYWFTHRGRSEVDNLMSSAAAAACFRGENGSVRRLTVLALGLFEWPVIGPLASELA